MVYAYLRQLTDSNSLSQQQQNILSYSLAMSLTIDKEVMEYSSINHTIEDREKFESFIHALKEGDIIITQSLLILSIHVNEIIKIINIFTILEITNYF
jgi:DNA invertase Pin-like site-specific DNA recombinase